MVTGAIDLANNVIDLKPQIMIGEHPISLDCFLIHYLEKLIMIYHHGCGLKPEVLLSKTIFAYCSVI